MKKGGTNKINKRLKNKGLHLYIENEFFVTNIQNPAAFVKCFGRFSGVVKEENYQLLGEKKLYG